MGGGMSLDDNQDVEHESGASRAGNALCAAICCAPILIIIMCGVLGWNERRAVCDAKALDAGLEVVQKIDCANLKAGDFTDKLVYMNCDLSKEGLQPLDPGSGWSGNVIGTGLKVKAEMYQCVEHEDKQSKKDKVGGGKTTVTTYTYTTEWVDHEISTSSFHKKGSDNYNSNCRGDNPAWPSELPKSGETYAPKVKVGAVTTDLTNRIPLESRVTEFTAPSGWSASGDEYTTPKYKVSGSDIGNVRVSFYTNDWSKSAVSLVGEYKSGDEIKPWTAPDAWLCSGFSVSDLLMGTHSKEELFKKLHAKANQMTWIIRLIGFLVMWFAFSLCFAPLEVAADCIPCIGPMLGDCMSCITCCVACLPGTACTLGVAGIVWCVMRPMVGIPMMIVWVVVMGYTGYYFATRKKSEKPLTAGLAQNPSYGAAAVVAQPVAQARQFQVQCPAGSGPGTLVQVQAPDGTTVQVTIPDGVAPGGTFMAQY